jgi:hypothetical protein
VASSASGSCPVGTGSTRCARDIHRVRLAQAFERSGISLQAIGTAIASGQLSFDFVDQMFIYHAPLTGKTFREIAEDLDLPLETLTRLYAMWGLPRPAPDDVVREDDAATFSPWKAVFSPELLNERLLTHGPVVPGRDRPPGLVGQLQQHRHQPGRGAATPGHLHRRGARPVAVAGAALRPPG